MLILGVMFPVDYAISDSEDLESYYNDYIDSKIDQCERIAEFEHTTTSPQIQEDAQIRREQADYYSKHRQKLIRQMMKRKLGMNPTEVDHFLTVHFFDSR
jgi:hypothetical protein